jgi:CBS domain-containing protein
MTNRKLAYIVKDQKPLVLDMDGTVQHACQCMRERNAGSVLVIDEQQRLRGIFTGRDAVRTLAEGKDATVTTLVQTMTPDPITITPDSRAIDALRRMSDGGFRHLPVIKNGRIWAIVARSKVAGVA